MKTEQITQLLALLERFTDCYESMLPADHTQTLVDAHYVITRSTVDVKRLSGEELKRLIDQAKQQVK